MKPNAYAISSDTEELDSEDLKSLKDSDVASAVLETHQGGIHAVNVENIVVLTARLAQVLAEEADLLADMRIAAIEELQKEKILLTRSLEKQKKLFDRHPGLLGDVSEEERARLEQIIDIFQSIMKENHRRLLIAREVNRKVVEVIAEAVSEASSQSLYTKKGAVGIPGAHSLSVSVDERI